MTKGHAPPQPTRNMALVDTRENLRRRLERLAVGMEGIARTCRCFDELYLPWCEAWPKISADVSDVDRDWFDRALLATAERVFNNGLLDARIAAGEVSGRPLAVPEVAV